MAKITPKTNKLIFTDEVLSLLPPNENIKRGVANKIKGEDPAYRENIQRKVKEQWETKDQSKRIGNIVTSITKLWQDPKSKQKYLEAQKNKTVPENYKGYYIATNIETGEEFIFNGPKEMKDAGFQPPNIYKCISGERDNHKGYTWRRVDK